MVLHLSRSPSTADDARALACTFPGHVCAEVPAWVLVLTLTLFLILLLILIFGLPGRVRTLGSLDSKDLLHVKGDRYVLTHLGEREVEKQKLLEPQ